MRGIIVNSDNFKKGIAFWIILLIGFMSISYALFFTDLKINISGTASNNWNINFEEFQCNDNGILTNYIFTCTNGSNCGNVTLKNNGQTISITNAKLNCYGSYLYYVMPVVNKGNIDAYLQNIKTEVVIRNENGEDITDNSNNNFMLDVTLYKVDSLTSDESQAIYLLEGIEGGVKNNVKIKGYSAGSNQNKTYLAMKISLKENNDTSVYSENDFEIMVTPSWASKSE